MEGISNKIKAGRPGETFPKWIRRILLAYLIAASLEMLLLLPGGMDLEGLTALQKMSLSRMLIVMAVVIFALWFLNLKSQWERIGICCAAVLLCACTAVGGFSWWLIVLCGILLGVLAVYAAKGWNGEEESVRETAPESKLWGVITGLIAIVFFLIVSIWTVCRVYSYSTPSYDFGIFSQMFYNMKASGLPVTTLERDRLLSHFAVHVSPVYYVLLPFYCLAPTPATLQVLQAAVITSSVIPLWKIARLHGLSSLQRTLLCVTFLALPALFGGVGYDIHENCFLTPLLLWLFYAIDSRKPLVATVAAILTLLVKEDAAVYVVIIGIWLIGRSLLNYQKQKKDILFEGIALVIVGLVYFWLVTSYLSKFGDGVMTYRYRNFIYDESGSLATVVKAVLLAPGKLLLECSDPEKRGYIIMTMLPLLGLPLFTRRYERFILLIPYVLVNLMSDYSYQHNIFFQYSFGSTACLIYLATINLGELKVDRCRTIAATLAAAVSVSCFCGTILPKATRYPQMCLRNGSTYYAIHKALEQIPQGASVTASTFYTTQLSERTTLYDLSYTSREHLLSSEYVVVSVTDSCKKYEAGESGKGQEKLNQLLIDNGFAVTGGITGVLKIYQLKKDGQTGVL